MPALRVSLAAVAAALDAIGDGATLADAARTNGISVATLKRYRAAAKKPPGAGPTPSRPATPPARPRAPYHEVAAEAAICRQLILAALKARELASLLTSLALKLGWRLVGPPEAWA